MESKELTPPNKPTISGTKLLRMVVLAVVFLVLTCLLYLGFQEDKMLTTVNQKLFYSLCFGALIAGLVTLMVSMQMGDGTARKRRTWFYPLMAGLLGLACMGLSYMFLGVWPLGDRSVMIVDMQHQYAPLLSELRDMILHGGNPLYSFDVGLGGSFLPLFAYYLASPFNLLLTLFPESLLNEGILVITLLKNALCAVFFALCVQYVYHRRDLSVVVVSIMYSMMMYLLAYSWNIMWLDCVMVLPLVIMSFERLMRTGRYLPYVLTLAYALYANYYIGFMLCVFLVLYFLCYSLRKTRTVEDKRRSFGRFAIGSLLGGGLVMFLLIPVYFALGQTSAAGGTLQAMNNNFDMFNLLGRHLFETSPTIRSGNLPNIYCGVLTVLLLPLYATMREIPLRRRLTYLGLLAVMGFSLVINQFDLIWHGLHVPNDLPYRFSFLYSFVLLLIAFETLGHLKHIRMRQLGGTVVGILAFLMIQERFGDEAYGFDSIYVSLLLVALYAALVALIAKRKVSTRPAVCALLLVVTIEMVTNGGATFKAMNSNEYFTARRDYVANDVTAALRTAVERTEQLGDQAADGAFYRMEFLPRRTIVDTALFDYRGFTVFASSNSQSLTKFMGYLGYASNGVNSHLYKQFVPTTDSLFGIRYLINSNDMSDIAQLTALEQTGSAQNPYTIYENSAALPVGFVVNPTVKSWVPSQFDPIASQNSLYASMTGNADPLYDMAAITVDDDSRSVASAGEDTGFTFNPRDGQSTAHFTATVQKTGQVYVFIDCGAAESISISGGRISDTPSPGEPFILSAGQMDAGSTLSIGITAESGCTGNIYVGTLREDVFSADLATLRESPLTIDSFSDTHFKGTVDAKKSGVLFTSIAYDEGWTVLVDGKKVETYAACDAMLAFDIPEGTHTVEMKFFTVGLIPGVVLSVLSLLLLLGLLWVIRRKKDPNNPGDTEFAAIARLFRRSPVSAASAAGAPSPGAVLEPGADAGGGAPSLRLPDTGPDTPANGAGEPENAERKGGAWDDHHSDAGL